MSSCCSESNLQHIPSFQVSLEGAVNHPAQPTHLLIVDLEKTDSAVGPANRLWTCICTVREISTRVLWPGHNAQCDLDSWRGKEPLALQQGFAQLRSDRALLCHGTPDDLP